MEASSRIVSMVEILSKKFQLLERMLGYTEEQSQAITEDDMEKLNRLVGKKSLLIKRIDTLDRQFEKEFSGIKEELGIESFAELAVSGYEGLQELRDCTERVVSMIERIRITEEENQGKAKRLLNVLEERMKKISRGKRLNSAYGDSSNRVPPYYMDKKR